MVKNLPAMQETWDLLQEDPCSREWQPTPVFLPGEAGGERSLAGYSLWGCKESDMTEWLRAVATWTQRSILTSLKIEQLYWLAGEGNGNPLRYSCLENPMDGGAWWAAVHGVAKCQERLSDFPFTFHFHALEKEMAPHPSILAWRVPGTEEPSGLPSMGSHRVGHDWSDLALAYWLARVNITTYCRLGVFNNRFFFFPSQFWN